MTGLVLHGRVVVVTRRPEQGQALRVALERLGATVLELPGLEIASPPDCGPVDAALRDLERFAWVAFTSGNGVRAVAERLRTLGLPVAVGCRGPRLAVVGGATAAAVVDAFDGETVSLRPLGEQTAGSLAAAFSRQGVAGSRVLLPVSSRGRPDLEKGLLEAGALVERVVAYETRTPEGMSRELEECLRLKPELFVFASPSAIDGLGSSGGLRGQRAVVIGPTTGAAAREAGLEVVAMAREPSVPALVAAVLEGLSRTPSGQLTRDP